MHRGRAEYDKYDVSVCAGSTVITHCPDKLQPFHIASVPPPDSTVTWGKNYVVFE